MIRTGMLLITAFALAACDDSDPPNPNTAENAWGACRGYIAQRLLSPSSADFPRYDPAFVIDQGNWKYRVVAAVEASNAFGVQLQKAFICDVEYAGRERWELVDLVIQ